ncbi:molecular chaperone [Orbus wheelerorum]|uniref:fimbrial biogenesis chaperone n=1 Tax=Orbus wheelerorum TaxID=3074111 RepID=UPI00370DC909
MLKKIIYTFILIAITLTEVYANGVQISGTRLIYDGSKNNASINISNNDDQVYLIQSWVTQNPYSKKASDDIFITTPPLFRLEANTNNSVRVVQTGKKLPSDRESVFWLNIKSIPSTNKPDGQNMLLIAVKTQIKLFYRPANLPGKSAEAYKKIQFINKSGRLAINNPTPYSVSFKSIKINGKDIANPPMVLPFETQYVNKNVSVNDNVSWQSINDFGGITLEEHATVRSNNNAAN